MIESSAARFALYFGADDASENDPPNQSEVHQISSAALLAEAFSTVISPSTLEMQYAKGSLNKCPLFRAGGTRMKGERSGSQERGSIHCSLEIKRFYLERSEVSLRHRALEETVSATVIGESSIWTSV